MPALIYLHGFLSSPQSAKAQQTQAWVATHRPDISYYCPALSPYPCEAQRKLEQLVASLAGENIGLVGSSLGGFWATYLVEKYDLPAVLVNPAVKPQERFTEFVGQTLKNYHSEDECRLEAADLQHLLNAYVEPLQRPENYWVMLQAGDETLDYRQAAEKYQRSELLVEEGGNHSFEGYEKWLPPVIDFLFDRRA